MKGGALSYSLLKTPGLVGCQIIFMATLTSGVLAEHKMTWGVKLLTPGPSLRSFASESLRLGCGRLCPVIPRHSKAETVGLNILRLWQAASSSFPLSASLALEGAGG